MSAFDLIDVLDKNSLQLGENFHKEYSWSSTIEKRIVQFNFQLVRTNKTQLDSLAIQLSNLLVVLSNKRYFDEDNKKYLKILYKMIGLNRDTICGKGEYNITYMMITIWYKFFPELAKYALYCCVNDISGQQSYGSWKDIKYLCHYCLSLSGFSSPSKITMSQLESSSYFPLIKYAISLANNQLFSDNNIFINYYNNTNFSSKTSTPKISLVSKWIPRESSDKFGFLYYYFATDAFSEYIETAKNPVQKAKAILKCKTQYRKLLSKLNIHLDTVQIKQCDRKWNNIDPNTITSITINRQSKAFLNLDKFNNERSIDSDRRNFAKKFESFIKSRIELKYDIKGINIDMVDFTKTALRIINNNCSNPSLETDILNSQWRNNGTKLGSLNKMIAMVDNSCSMNGNPLHAAIALGIRIAEKSSLGRRVLSFNTEPKWVNLDNDSDFEPTFIEMVGTISNIDWGGSTDFFKALDLILTAIIQLKMTAVEAEDVTLVILSDMQINESQTGFGNNKYLTMYDAITERYYNAGLKLNGIPLKPPHIIFWNLRSTNGFPVLTDQYNTSMVSGYSPVFLESFCNKGVEYLSSVTPYFVLLESLSNKRYDCLDKTFMDSY